ncbi:MAG: flagellar hook-associated protein FlgL [Thermodesulfovibrionales bacterium]|nr:flagellar hook-associated protein FlgL [Thermodesulfovibrionales bacterium]
MRITTKMIYDKTLFDMQSNVKQIWKWHEQLSTGQKINRPSDDSSAMTRIIGYKDRLSEIDQYKRTIATTTINLNATNTALRSLKDLLQTAKDLIIKVNGMTQEDRNIYAKQVEGIRQSIISIANTKVGERYLFGGFAGDQPPIDPQTGFYQGTNDPIVVDIGKGVSIPSNMPGSDIFSFNAVSGTPTDAVFSNGSGYNPTTSPNEFDNTFSVPFTTFDPSQPNNPNTNYIQNPNQTYSAGPPVQAGYYDFNNNYLNENYVLRAVNFLQKSLEVDPAGLTPQQKTEIDKRLDKAYQYFENLIQKVSQKEADVSIRLVKLNDQNDFLDKLSADNKDYLSEELAMTPDDIARVNLLIQMKEQSLQSLRKVSSDFMKTSLFDFI